MSRQKGGIGINEMLEVEGSKQKEDMMEVEKGNESEKKNRKFLSEVDQNVMKKTVEKETEKKGHKWRKMGRDIEIELRGNCDENRRNQGKYESEKSERRNED